MAKAVARTKKAPVRRPWSKDDVRLLKGYGSQGTRLKDCESSQANRGRNASKGDEPRRLGQHDAQEASAREKALRWRPSWQTA